MEYFIFAVPCVSLLYSALSKLIWPEEMVRRELRQVSEKGLRKHVLTSSWPAVITGACFLASYYFAELGVLWVIIGLISFITPLFILFRKSDESEVASMFSNIPEEAVDTMIRKRRTQAYGSIALLVVWIYSWRHLFE
jgi:hypothetical protein